MKTICLISPGLSGCGGMERSLTSLANYFVNEGYQVTVINLFKTDIFFELDARVRVIWPKFEREKHNRIIYSILILPFLRKAIRNEKADVVLSFGEWFNSYVIIATVFLNTRLFITDRMGPNLRLGFLLEVARKITYKYASGIIAQTNIAKEIIYKKTKAKNILVIPNAVNPINVETNSKSKIIISVGRLSREKGHIVLLKAFATIKHNGWSLHLVGDGIQINDLKEVAKELKIESSIVFHGHVKDIGPLLGNAEIFVLPSFYEGFPNALVEAMSVPLACISSNCIAGPSDIIKEGINGMLFEVGNHIELATKIDQLINNKILRENIKLNAYKVRNEFEFKRIVKLHLDFLFNY